MKLILDRREHALHAALDGAIQFEVQSLPVGDITCTYDDGSMWICERKTAHDLAGSIKIGRWADQCKRLNDAGCKIFFIIEGDLKETALPYNALISALLNAELRKNTHVIRTVDVKESAAFVKHLTQKCEGTLPAGIATNITEKRKRDADPDLVFIRQLMCIPTISKNIATKLKEQFGTITHTYKKP